jgi:soluble lytic murein transglycosylase-like protein
MADDLDRFVLSYTVDVKDSIGRLEKLNEKMGQVGKGAKSSAGDIKNFASDASSELGKLVPGMNAVGAAIKAMGAEFAVAGAALGALALGVKALMNMREQYNQQRGQGMDLGVSSMRMENWQRQFVRQGGGYVSRDSAAEGLKNFSEMANSAYTDPSRTGKEARLMRMLGVDVGARGATPTGLTARLSQLASGLQGKSTGDVQGIAKATGMNQDWLLTLQRLGPEVSHITDLTQQEIDNRAKAESSLSKFNQELATLKEKFTELSNELAEPLLPALTKLVEIMTKLAATIPNAVHDVQKTGLTGNVHSAAAEAKAHPQKGGGLIGWWRRLNGIPDADYQAAQNAAHNDPNRYNPQKKADAKKEQENRDKAIDKMDQSNKQGVQTANEMSLAVNMFAGAVQSFSSAINISQAWAAWAGEIGRANNLPGSSGSGASTLSGGGRGNWTTSPYAPQIRAASSAYGLDPQMLYSIMMTESHGINGKYSETGAGGLMQVTKGNWKAYGAGDVMDPAGNIMVGARIYKEMLARSKGDTAAALNGYNGNSDPKYVSKVSGFYGSSGKGIGASKADMNIMAVQQQVADYLHVPLQQIQQGGVHRGDASWAASQLDAGMQNGIYDIKRQLATGGLPQQTYAKLQQDLITQSRGLDLLRQYSGDVVNAQPAGDRTRTIGEMPIYININGATDPKAVGQAVNDALRKSMADLVNNNATGIKG